MSNSNFEVTSTASVTPNSEIIMTQCHAGSPLALAHLCRNVRVTNPDPRLRVHCGHRDLRSAFSSGRSHRRRRRPYDMSYLENPTWAAQGKKT
jgi:hypothetical protein